MVLLAINKASVRATRTTNKQDAAQIARCDLGSIALTRKKPSKQGVAMRLDWFVVNVIVLLSQ